MKTMQCTSSKQSGLVIVMLVLVLVVLLGVAALALDLGRLYVLKSEMQSAADAAALAGAAELNARDDAIERAELAAKGLLEHDSHFSKVTSLLGNAININLTFYCSIGSKQDVGASCPGAQDPDDGNKILLQSLNDDDQAHYIKVTLDPEQVDNEDRYGIDLYFLPVLKIFGIDAASHAVTTATAIAGRHFYFCNYPPVMICDPFEASGGFRANVDPGDQILLKLQGGPNSKWGPGTFGFLDPDLIPAGGAAQLGPYLANEGNVGCLPPFVMPETGQMATPMKRAMNTRFDEYGAPPFNQPDSYQDYPPATNITNYGDTSGACPLPAGYCAANPTEPVCWRDSVTRCPGGVYRIGDGDWEKQGYWDAKHSGVPAPPQLNTMMRYDVYMYEIANGMIPDQPEFAHRAYASDNRRVIFVAVMACDALDLSPNDIFPIVEPHSGFAKMFVTERVPEPPNTNFFVEFMGWASEDDADYHVVVQLYE